MKTDQNAAKFCTSISLYKVNKNISQKSYWCFGLRSPLRQSFIHVYIISFIRFSPSSSKNSPLISEHHCDLRKLYVCNFWHVHLPLNYTNLAVTTKKLDVRSLRAISVRYTLCYGVRNFLRLLKHKTNCWYYFSFHEKHNNWFIYTFSWYSCDIFSSHIPFIHQVKQEWKLRFGIHEKEKFWCLVYQKLKNLFNTTHHKQLFLMSLLPVEWLIFELNQFRWQKKVSIRY